MQNKHKKKKNLNDLLINMKYKKENFEKSIFFNIRNKRIILLKMLNL